MVPYTVFVQVEMQKRKESIRGIRGLEKVTYIELLVFRSISDYSGPRLARKTFCSEFPYTRGVGLELLWASIS